LGDTTVTVGFTDRERFVDQIRQDKMRDDVQQLLVERLNLGAEISAGKAEIERTQKWIERQPSEVAMDMFLTPLKTQLAEMESRRRQFGCPATDASCRCWHDASDFDTSGTRPCLDLTCPNGPVGLTGVRKRASKYSKPTLE
jgi:hypothetical protein